MSLKLYVDSDDVLADWEGSMVNAINHPDIVCRHTLNKHPNRDQLIRGVYKKIPDFFAHLPLISHGVDLVNALKEAEIPFEILTAVGSDHHSFEIVKECKLQWFKHHFGIQEEQIICVPLSSDKVAYSGKDKILVDDYDKNIHQWNAGGGVGHLFKKDKETVRDILADIQLRYNNHILVSGT